MSISELEARIRKRLSERSPRQVPEGQRPAAVLLPLLRYQESFRLLLTKRASGLRRQPGQIAFPGGAIEAGDVSPLAAALRECQEEVGLHPKDVTVLGQMDERETIAGFRITPFVGSVAAPYRFKTNHEVSELLEVPLTALQEPSVLEIEYRRLEDGSTREIYHYQYGRYDIWGITGRLVKELLEVAQL